MSDHEAKVELRPRTPEATLEALMPWGTNSYGSRIRTNKVMRLLRTDTVDLDYNEQIHQTRTLWMLTRLDGTSTYNRQVLEQSGHFHANAKGALVGFCPNETLEFRRVTELVEMLTKPNEETL